MNIKRVGLTLGDPAGIGPDIALHVLASELASQITIIGSKALLTQRATQLGQPTPNFSNTPLIDIPLNCPITAGQPNIESADFVMTMLDKGIDACLQGDCSALVTGPINKSLLNQAGIPFLGHTEHLAKRAQIDTVLMSFFTPQLILGLYSTHLPLSVVPGSLNQATLIEKLTLFYQALEKHFGRAPKIGVLGLNPHAGEQGYLGTEEISIISPALAALRAEHYHFDGPLSADSAFSPMIRCQYDALFAMYHDQGLCGLKAIDFGESVNVTLGLPFVRTSVDHGTAYDKAGTGQADPKSLMNAIQVAYHFIGAPS